MRLKRRRRRPVRTASRPSMEGDPTEAAEELEAIQEQMLDLLGQAGRLLRGSVGVNSTTYRRAEGYWMAAMTHALKKGDSYGVSMEHTINELYEDGEDYEEEY